MNVGVIRRLCSFPGGSRVWIVPKLLGVSWGDPISTLNALKMFRTKIVNQRNCPIYFEVDTTDPAVTLLECWSTNTWKFDSVKCLKLYLSIYQNLKPLLSPYFCRVYFVFIFILSFWMLFLFQQSWKFRVAKNILLIEGAANSCVCRDWLE